MAGKAAAAGAGVLLVTANVGSLFDDPENLQKNWLREFYQVVHAHKPHFMALHCQEFGGKNYEASMSHVDKFVKELLSSDAMKDYNRARVYLDENYKSQEHFTCKWSRKGFIRTRWCITDCAFDLVNIHLFHDASNLIAWETSPSVYSGIRHKALGYVLDRIIDQRFEKVSYFVFGDFNFRLDAKAVVETLCAKATMQTIRAADTNEVVKLIFRESDNDRKVMLQLEKKLFDYFNQDVFRDNNGTALLEFDRELSVFKDRLYELDISFPPSYPYSEDSSQGRQYMNTRCPAWCDRILMSHSAKELILKSENDEKMVIYDHIGPNVCMGDHKEKDAYEVRRFSVKPHCSQEGRQHTEICNPNSCIDKSSPECHIFRLLIVHYASASGLCSRDASHTSLSCMFM
ncbi:inositol polyphosphate-5-phosphatase A isoform X5 [Ammospiza nelsoni]|uniref:inositol polyphosphate-5-phosphatase A isoform X5 n=1 Tax=Ammospiza nelsoni TaxID=2857394 RepID=UPI00286BC956|nr:inositol polyphosphate-5-phosphatase A isoform X5 [Ammospiza nelsoni]